jgi:hypothetical protein
MKNLFFLLAVALPFLTNAQCDSLLITGSYPTAVCENEFVNILLTDYENRKGGTWSSSNGNFANNRIKGFLKETTTFYYTYTDAANSCTSTDSIIIKSNKAPKIQTIPPADVCWNAQDFPLTFNATPYGGTWFDTLNQPSHYISSNRFYPSKTPKQNTIVRYPIFYTYTDPTTLCADTVESTIKVKPVPDIKLKSEFFTLAINDSFLYLDTIPEPSFRNGKWEGDGVINIVDSGYYFKSSLIGNDTTKTYTLTYGYIDRSGLQPFCSGSIDFLIKLTKSGLTTNLKAEEKSNQEIFPNPSNGKITIKNDLPFHLKVYNLGGQLIYMDQTKEKLKSIELNPGVYWIKTVDVKHSKTQKVVVY